MKVERSRGGVLVVFGGSNEAPPCGGRRQATPLHFGTSFAITTHLLLSRNVFGAIRWTCDSTGAKRCGRGLGNESRHYYVHYSNCPPTGAGRCGVDDSITYADFPKTPGFITPGFFVGRGRPIPQSNLSANEYQPSQNLRYHPSRRHPG